MICFSGGEGILYVEATKPGKVTLIGLYLETKCIEQLTISVIYKDESGLEEDNFLVSVKMLLFAVNKKNKMETVKVMATGRLSVGNYRAMCQQLLLWFILNFGGHYFMGMTT